MFLVARQWKRAKFPCKASFAAKFSLTSTLVHPLTRKPLREKTATKGGRKQGFCIYCPILIILRYNDSIPPGHSMKKR